jgi:glycosyltransferase involved in cell wall biosynthesis
MINFSIITVTYNASKFFNHTVNSVLVQGYPHIEHIIIDGASTDETLTLAKDYSERSYASGNGHEVRILSEPDNGLYDAMNKGLQMANGDYVCFLNAGDSLPFGDTIETIVANAELDDIRASKLPLPAVIYGDTDVVDSSGSYLFRRRLTPPEQLTWRSFRHGMLVCHQAFYVRADIAKELSYNTQYKYSADVDWCIRVMKEADKRGLLLKNVHATIVNYMQEGLTTKNHKSSLKERYHIMASHYGSFDTVVMHIMFIFRAFFKH